MSEFSNGPRAGISRHCRRREVSFVQQTLLFRKAWQPRYLYLSGLKVRAGGRWVR